MNEISTLKDLMKQSREKCPWSKEQEIKGHMHELKRETEEVFEALEKNDYENLKEELGDILMDLIFITVITEEKKLFSLNDITNSAIEKIKRRKPWVFGKETVVSKEHAARRWDEIKAQEKKNLINN